MRHTKAHAHIYKKIPFGVSCTKEGRYKEQRTDGKRKESPFLFYFSFLSFLPFARTKLEIGVPEYQ
jgi:hypothetical protein